MKTLREKLKDVSDVIPENLGTLGYDGQDGLYVKNLEMVTALETDGLALEFYRSYNVSWTRSWKYFDVWNDIDPADLLPCSETRSTNALEMKTDMLDVEIKDINMNNARCMNRTMSKAV